MIPVPFAILIAFIALVAGVCLGVLVMAGLVAGSRRTPNRRP